jgi:toxin ParE1/3/4
MNYFFHPEAEIEFIEAVEYYEDCQQGLGHDFAIEVNLTIERLLLYPEAWPEIDEDIRRILLKRYPYGILYSIKDDNIFILAMMNLHREPDYWKKRNK